MRVGEKKIEEWLMHVQVPLENCQEIHVTQSKRKRVYARDGQPFLDPTIGEVAEVKGGRKHIVFNYMVCTTLLY